MMNNQSFNNGEQIFQFFSKLTKLSDNDLNNFVDQARKLGISNDNISQGLFAIQSLRHIFNNCGQVNK